MKTLKLHSCVTGLFASLCLSATGLADVIYVDAGGNGQFTAIQPAITAAIDGDVLLVRTGTYSGFTLDNRSLSLIADAGALPVVTGTIIVRNTSATSSVLLAGIDVKPPMGNHQVKALDLSNNAGNVRFQTCHAEGSSGYTTTGGPQSAGGVGASIVSSLKVVFADCSLLGGNGGGIPLFIDFGGDGGHGVVTQGSSVAFYDCLLKGGYGGEADYFTAWQRGGDGGDGCRVLDFGVLASGTTFQGGRGGGQATIAGDGGDGLVVNVGGQAQLIGNTYAGGFGGIAYGGSIGAPGLPQSGGGIFHTFTGKARKMSAAVLAPESGSVQFNLSGEPGDSFWFLTSGGFNYVYVPTSAGILCVPQPCFASARPNAVLPASGTASLVLATPDVAAGVQAQRQIRQCVVVSASGQVRLSSPSHVIVLNCSDLAPDCNANGSCDSCDLANATSIDCDRNGVPDECSPDCNANGITDACDIASGLSVDSNHNGVPDECEPQTTWHVSVNAGPGGNGSAGAPFTNLAEAFTAAINGDVVLVANGVYQGAANRDLDFDARRLTVKSALGAANCIIDCQLLGRAFILNSGVPATSSVEGFTIRNGKASGGTSRGGGIYVNLSSPTVRQCVFESCEAQSGGGLALESSGSLVEGCTFVANHCTNGQGGGLFAIAGNNVRVLDCLFVGNQATDGGALCVSQLNSRIERSLFHSNTATATGGGIYGYYGDVSVDQCWISGNTALRGGGISGRGSKWRLSDCTLSDNRATQRAGAAFYFNDLGTPRIWRNNIFWNNTSPSGTAIEVEKGNLDVDWCDIQGAQASITLGATASLSWGLGNMNVDPLFVDPDGIDNNPLTIDDNNYRLSLGSPCLDAGQNSSVPADLFDFDGDGNVTEPVPFDFDGNSRFIDIPSAPNTGSGTSPLVDLGAWERP